MLHRIAIATITAVALSGCHLAVGAFVAAKGYDKKDIPPKIEDPPGWGSTGQMSKRNRLWVWNAAPEWGRMDYEIRGGKYHYSRQTSNHPMVQVWREPGLCRWTPVHLEQRRSSEVPDGRPFTDRDTFFIEVGTTKHYEADCKKLKKLLAPDARYAEILPKL
ncbi:MAG: hypothetical protein M4D80_08400 [Myxococcota bacterium]|nr:hypothetical protein [Myxococcota bacterium]